MENHGGNHGGLKIWFLLGLIPDLKPYHKAEFTFSLLEHQENYKDWTQTALYLFHSSIKFDEILVHTKHGKLRTSPIYGIHSSDHGYDTKLTEKFK